MTTRRSFLIFLGATAVAFNGGALGHGKPGYRPQLHSGLRLVHRDGCLNLHRPDGRVLGVSPMGERILGFMDGKRGFKDLVACYARSRSMPVTSDLEAKVALFLSDLSAEGLLESTCRTFVFERYV